MHCHVCGASLQEAATQPLRALGIQGAICYRCTSAADWHYTVILDDQQYTLHPEEWRRYRDLQVAKKHWDEILFRRRVSGIWPRHERPS